MRAVLLGRSPRLTGYLCGLSIGLSLLVIGLEAGRVSLTDLSATQYRFYVAIGVLAGVLFSFVAGYLNGGLLASWTMGSIPTAGRLADLLVSGSLSALPVTLCSSLGIGVFLGTLGYVIAIEKHRSDARSATLPPVISRADLLRAVGLSTVVAGVLFGFGLLL